MSDKSIKINFYVPADLVEWLRAESKRTGVPSAELCRRALQAFMYLTIAGADIRELQKDATASWLLEILNECRRPAIAPSTLAISHPPAATEGLAK